MAAVRTFAALFGQDTAFSTPAAPYGSIDAATGPNAVGHPVAPDVLAAVTQLATHSKIVVALVTDEDPRVITMVQLPTQYNRDVQPTPMDGQVFGFVGPTANSILPIACPEALFEVIQVETLNTHAAVYTALTRAPTPSGFTAFVNNGDDGSHQITVRRGLVMPLEWAVQAATAVSVSAQTFYDTFLQSVIGNATYDPAFTWWCAAATRTQAADTSLVMVNTNQILSFYNRSLLKVWASTTAGTYLSRIDPPTPGPDPENALTPSFSADSESSEKMHQNAVMKEEGPSDPVMQPLEFMNRENECEQIARLFLENRRQRARATQAFGLRSQFRMTLATCAQMFGSGKSTFGSNVLPRLRDDLFADRMKRLQKEEKYTEDDIGWLLNLQYVGIDLRDRRRGWDFLKALRRCLFTALQELVRDRGRATKLVRELSGATCSEIVSTFENELGKSFLIHLDEFSQIESEDENLKVYYQVWGEISQIHYETNSEIFCSGRSPTIYLLGKGKIKCQYQSPEDAECIILDPLERDHVNTIFKKFGVTTEGEEFCDKVHEFTGGVPRFVAHAVDYFTCRFHEVEEEEAKSRRNLFQSDTSGFLQYLCKHATNEMNPLEVVPKHQRVFYLEMIRIAALQLPLNLDREITGSNWGLKTSEVTLDVCSVYPLYLKNCRVEGEVRHFLVIPPAILDNISLACTDPRVPFWASLYKTNPFHANAQDAGSVLELMAQQCLRLRVSEELNQRGRKLEDILDFVRGSKVADKTFTPASNSAFKEFPKITSSPTPGKSAEKLRKYFEDPRSAGFSDVHPSDLPKVYESLESGFFYVPRPKSSSADLIFKTDGPDSCFIEWQFKNGKQQVDGKMLEAELQKSICCVAAGQEDAFSAVFVMVGLTVGELPEGGEAVRGRNGDTIAVRYGEADVIHNAVLVPKGLQVIVVLEKGLLTFLTEQNISVLKKGDVGLDEISYAILSSSRKKRRSS